MSQINRRTSVAHHRTENPELAGISAQIRPPQPKNPQVSVLPPFKIHDREPSQVIGVRSFRTALLQIYYSMLQHAYP